MDRRKSIAVVISVLFLTILAGSVAVEYNNGKDISHFHLDTYYFNPIVSATYFSKQDTQNFTSFYTPDIKSLEGNYSEKSVNFSFGEYTILVTPNLQPIPVGPINLHNFSSANLSSVSDPLGYIGPDFGIAMVKATGQSPGFLGFTPIDAKVLAPNGSNYVFNLRGESYRLIDTIYGYPINIGPYYNVGTGGIRPTNYSMKLMPGQYMLQVTVSLYHFQSIGYTHLTDLSFTLPYYNFIEK